MKRTTYYVGAATLLLALLTTGCNNTIELPADEPQPTGNQSKITVSIGDATSRTTVTDPDDGTLKVVWKTGDKIALFQDNDVVSATYTLSEGDGKSIAEFTKDPDTPELDEGKPLHAVYPAKSGESSKNWNIINRNVEIPQQKASAPLAYLENNCPMTADIAPGKLGEGISFKHRTAILRFKVTLPTGKVPQKFTLVTTSEPGFRIAETLKIAASGEVKEHILPLDGYTTNALTVYLPLFPTTLNAGEELKVKVLCTDGNIYSYRATLPAGGVKYEAGKVYSVSLGGGGMSLISQYDNAIASKTLTDYTTYTLSGSGTAESPYLIQSANDLRFMQLKINEYGYDMTYRGAYLKLTTDIEISANPETYPWIPIGFDPGTNFYGSFDGDNHIISGTIKGSSLPFGFFGRVMTGTRDEKQYNAEIKNLHVAADIISENTTTGVANFGGIVGILWGACTDCTVSGNVKCLNTASNLHIAGIVGSANDPASITRCEMKGSLSASGSSAIAAGGILSVCNIPVTACTNNANLSVTLTGADFSGYAGGITGRTNSNGLVSNCTNRGNITAAGLCYSLDIGGIVGANSCKIEGSANYGSLQGKNTSQPSQTLRIGGIIGYMGSGEVITSHNHSTTISALSGNTATPYLGSLVGYLHTSGLVYNTCTSVSVGTLPLIGNSKDNVNDFKDDDNSGIFGNK